jgi:hypothetical protein
MPFKGWFGLAPNRRRSAKRNWRGVDELDASHEENAAIVEDEGSAEGAAAAAEAAIKAIERARKNSLTCVSARG